MSSPAIEINGLTRRFGKVEALRGLDVTVPQGSVCGFLGRNGAGKTTTLKILLGLTRPDSGQASIFGLNCTNEADSIEIRRRTGFVSEPKTLYPYMTVEQIIRFTRPFFPKWRSDLETRYVRTFELPTDRRICKLSKGMQSKLNLLLALCRGAEVLILDEATEGMDPAATEEILQSLMTQVAEDGTTVFFSSHQLHEVEQIADRVCLIHKGQTVFQESLDDLRLNTRRVQAVIEPGTFEEAMRRLGAFGAVTQDGRTVSVMVRAGAADAIELCRTLRATSIDVQPVTLKELFLETVRS